MFIREPHLDRFALPRDLFESVWGQHCILSVQISQSRFEAR